MFLEENGAPFTLTLRPRMVELQCPAGAVDEQHITVMLVRRYLARIKSRSNVDEASADHGSERSSAVQHDLVQHYPCREVNGRFV